MIRPDGTRDTTTEVYWLQSVSLFADLRVPADRPAGTGKTGFDNYTDAELTRLARMSGFGGVLEVEGSVCRWLHALDFHPAGRAPDEAHFRLDGDVLVETGIHANYEEIWHRVTPPGAPSAAFCSDEPGREGILVVAGGFFLSIESRSSILPEAESLAALVERDLAASDRNSAIVHLDMRIAHGRAGGDWPIVRSTHPWLEETGLFAGQMVAFDGNKLEIAGNRRWRLVESNVGAGELARYF